MNFYTAFTFVLYPVFFVGVFAFLFFTCDRVDEMDVQVEKKVFEKTELPDRKTVMNELQETRDTLYFSENAAE